MANQKPPIDLSATAQRLRIETGLDWLDGLDESGFAGSRFTAMNRRRTAFYTLEEIAPCVWELHHDQTRLCRVRDLGAAIQAVEAREGRHG